MAKFIKKQKKNDIKDYSRPFTEYHKKNEQIYLEVVLLFYF